MQNGIASRIVLGPFHMRRAVGLDDQSCRGAIEVRDKGSKRLLSAELRAG